MSSRFGHDMSGFDLDGPVPKLPLSNAIQTHAKIAYEKARKENLTLRDIYNQIAVARGYLFACGDAAMVADVMEEWFADRACDGFVLVPLTSPPPLMSSLIWSCLSCKGAASFVGSIRGLLSANISACRCQRTDIQSACPSSSGLVQRRIFGRTAVRSGSIATVPRPTPLLLTLQERRDNGRGGTHAWCRDRTCCVRAASGHAAAPPSSVMNSRRFTRSPRRRGRVT